MLYLKNNAIQNYYYLILFFDLCLDHRRIPSELTCTSGIGLLWEVSSGTTIWAAEWTATVCTAHTTLSIGLLGKSSSALGPTRQMGEWRAGARATAVQPVSLREQLG